MGKEQRREAPVVSSGPPPPKTGAVTCFSNSLQNQEFCELLPRGHARKRVVPRDKQSRGLKGRHMSAERFIHTFSEAPHGKPYLGPGFIFSAKA